MKWAVALGKGQQGTLLPGSSPCKTCEAFTPQTPTFILQAVCTHGHN